MYHPLAARTYLRKCKDVISFEDLNTLEHEDLRSMRRAGHRFPKYFKGSLRWCRADPKISLIRLVWIRRFEELD